MYTLCLRKAGLTHYRPAMPFGNREIYFRGSFPYSIVTIQKKYNPSGRLKFNHLGIFQSLKLRILMAKILSISYKLNFTPITLGWVKTTLRKIR